MGTAQNLDIARGPWARVKAWSDPEPDTAEAEALAIPALQAATEKVVDTNGKESIRARNQAHYEIRAASSARGKPAARVIMDELREQRTWAAWNAASQTSKSFWAGQVWGISNAGDPTAVVLKTQRDRSLELIEEWDRYVGAGLTDAETYANDPAHDVSLGLFEWSAPDGCDLADVDAILQANPSIGYGNATVADALSDAGSMPEADYRTEVLCQWVAARVATYISPRDFEATHRPSADVTRLLERGARTVWGVDTSRDRSMTYVAAATYLSDGSPFVTVRTQRAGMIWLPAYLQELAEASSQWEVAVQSRGCPATEYVEPLEAAGFTVHGIDGSRIGLATGRFHDRVRDGALVTVAQPVVRLAIEGGVTARYAENDAWSRTRSLTDVAPVIAETVALFGLETLQPEAAEPVLPPPSAAIVRRDDAGDVPLENLATVRF